MYFNSLALRIIIFVCSFKTDETDEGDSDFDKAEAEEIKEKQEGTAAKEEAEAEAEARAEENRVREQEKKRGKDKPKASCAETTNVSLLECVESLLKNADKIQKEEQKQQIISEEGAKNEILSKEKGRQCAVDAEKDKIKMERKEEQNDEFVPSKTKQKKKKKIVPKFNISLRTSTSRAVAEDAERRSKAKTVTKKQIVCLLL